MQPVAVRPATPADAHLLSRIGWETFLATFVEGFAMPYSADDLAHFRAASYAPEQFTALLESPAGAGWIAERGGEPVGFATIGGATLPHPDIRSGQGELKRLYVRGAEQGGGLARRLMDTALARLERDAPGPVWLGVWSGNLRAQRFYARYGFERAGEYVYEVGAARDHEFILRRG